MDSPGDQGKKLAISSLLSSKKLFGRAKDAAASSPRISKAAAKAKAELQVGTIPWYSTIHTMHDARAEISIMNSVDLFVLRFAAGGAGAAAAAAAGKRLGADRGRSCNLARAEATPLTCTRPTAAS